MNPFTFQTTPNVLFEAGAAKKIAGLVSEFGAERALFVTDKGVRGAGLTQNAEQSLAAGCNLTVFEDVVADPPAHVVEAAVALCREKQVEAVVSIGGGSALDTGKACRLPGPVRRSNLTRKCTATDIILKAEDNK